MRDLDKIESRFLSTFFVIIITMVMPMLKRRDKMGFISLDESPLNNIKVVNSHSIISFVCEGKKYFFKRTKSTNQTYNELLGYEFALEFGIDAIPYDIASLDGFTGSLSEDFSNYHYVFLEDVLTSYYGDDRCKNNLYDVSLMFMSIYPEEKVSDLLEDFRRLLMFDIIIGNSDRHSGNILVDSNSLRLGPVFDNEMLGNRDCYFSFSMTGHDDNTISEYLSILSETELNLFRKKLDIISESNILKIIGKIEKKIGSPLVDGIKEEIIGRYRDIYNYLLKVFNVIKGRSIVLKK